jgi:D-alanyl-lipoteichoic acid acyltransferase DltB (MBOAT superfamily)
VVFVAVVVGLYRLCPVRFRYHLLLAASYVFYCAWNPIAAVALASATILIFFAGKWVADPQSQHRATIIAALAVIALTGYLILFKIAAAGSLESWGLVMPLGLSYYTFKLISYVMDIYWRKMEPAPRFIPFAAYVAFFPQMVAGPIQRPADFLSQAPLTRTAISEGLPRIAWGLAKKLAIADQLAPAIAYVFSHVRSVDGAGLLAAFYLFPLQVYADFSGLTDIAIGTGLLFGIEAPENFNRPFTASTIAGFWRRWHMSLTSWLTDYVFTPLRMATRRAGNAGLELSITINMVAIGLWHGLTWCYLSFGLLHAGYLIVETLTARPRARFFKRHPKLDGPGDWLGSILVFHLVAVAFVFFGAHSVADAAWLLSHLWVGIGSLGSNLARFTASVGLRPLTIGLAGYGLLELAERFRPDRWIRSIENSMPQPVRQFARAAILVYLVFIVLMLVMAPSGADRPFIYGAF